MTITKEEIRKLISYICQRQMEHNFVNICDEITIDDVLTALDNDEEQEAA